MQAIAASDDGNKLPIILIHSIERPFCNQPGCWCHANKACAVPLFAAVNKGELTVYKVVSSEDEEGDAHES